MVKQFAVIGCGRFGSSVAKTLYTLGYDVIAIDKSESAIVHISEDVTHAVQLDATNLSSLKSIGIRNFDTVIIAIGSNIESSLLATLQIKELGVKCIVAKAQNDIHAKLLSQVGATRVVFPEMEMGVRIAHNLISSNILDQIELDPNYSIVEVSTLGKWVGKTLNELNIRERYGVNIMAIKKGHQINISPSPFDVVDKNDVLIVIGHNDDLKGIKE
jgi:trk system potassium uptake protein TrkA